MIILNENQFKSVELSLRLSKLLIKLIGNEFLKPWHTLDITICRGTPLVICLSLIRIFLFAGQPGEFSSLMLQGHSQFIFFQQQQQQKNYIQNF